MHPSVLPIAAAFRLNTELLLNCLDGVSEEQVRSMPAGRCNHMAFLTAHLVESRYHALSLMGSSTPNPLGFLQSAKSQDDVAVLPPTADLVAMWEQMSAQLAVAIERLDTADLARQLRPFPGADGTLLGNLAFLAQHESYHIGQLGLLRRQVGLPAMSYALRPREPGRRGA
jgi:uncharacterized damage-inducible protein DinB